MPALFGFARAAVHAHQPALASKALQVAPQRRRRGIDLFFEVTERHESPIRQQLQDFLLPLGGVWGAWGGAVL